MKVVERFKQWKETRFFKKHGVSSWRQYYLKYDPDYDFGANSIRQMFFGYPYIAEIQDSAALKTPDGWLLDGLQYLYHWLENECRGKARAKIERVIPTTITYADGTVTKDWGLNEFCRDSLFVAFQDERDYLMFLLKWETA